MIKVGKLYWNLDKRNEGYESDLKKLGTMATPDRHTFSIRIADIEYWYLVANTNEEMRMDLDKRIRIDHRRV